MPMSGVQDLDRFRERPQPLGVFCEFLTDPAYPKYWVDDRDDPLVGLKITRSGLVSGIVINAKINENSMPVGLRRMRCAV